MSEECNDAGDVGYGRPPRETRFVKGQSGNPSGKRKGARSQVKELERFLDTPIVVTEKGRRKTMRPIEIVRTKAFQLAAQGDVRAIKLMFDLEKHLAVYRGVEKRQQVDLSRSVERFKKLAGGLD